MKNFIKVVSPEEYDQIVNDRDDFEKVLSKNKFEFESLEDLISSINDIQKNFFISHIKIINMLNCEEYNKLCSIDITTRTGLNYKTVTEVGHYRFNQICTVNNNVLIRRYFILDFSKTINVDGIECADQIFEVNTESFCILICEICSAKQDLEDNLYIDDAKKYLIHMESVIKRFIEKYFELRELNLELDKDGS